MLLLVMRRYALLLLHSAFGMQLHNTTPPDGAIAVVRVAGSYVVHHWLLSTHHGQRPPHHASLGSLL